MKKLKKFLIKNNACSDGLEYAKNMTLEEFYHNCERGDWLVWLFAKTNPNNLKELVLAAAHCANACKHLLKDERSLKAINAALNFESYSKEELYRIYSAAPSTTTCTAYAAAHDAVYTAYTAARVADDAINIAAYTAADAPYTAADAAAAAAFAALWAARAALWAARAADAAAAAAAFAAYAAAAYGAADHAAEALKDPQLIADIVKQQLPLEIWNQDIINN